MSEREKRINKALEYFMSGLNCSQSTATPFCDLVGMEEKTMLNAMSGFGGGVGRLREICGVASGITMIIGLNEDRDYSDDESKKEIYIMTQDLIKKFEQINGSFICGDLLDIVDKSPIPSERTKEYYMERPCAKLVEDGATIICDYLGIK